jgi:hypothetical protein
VPPLANWKICIYPPSRHSLFSLFLSRTAPFSVQRAGSSLPLMAAEPLLPPLAGTQQQRPSSPRSTMARRSAPCSFSLAQQQPSALPAPPGERLQQGAIFSSAGASRPPSSSPPQRPLLLHGRAPPFCCRPSSSSGQQPRRPGFPVRELAIETP